MNIPYPLKNTLPIDIFSNFKTSIEKYYGPSYFPPVSGFFTNLVKLRNELDYVKYQKMIQADTRLCEELEGKVLKYLSFALILDRKFKFESNFPKNVNLPFTWTDSFNSNVKIQVSSMKYEIVGHLYNLAIAELMLGSSMIVKSEDDDKKQALKRFRLGIWAIKEIKIMLPSINFNAMQKTSGFSDFTLQNLSIIENLFLGLSYFALFEIHEKNEITLGYNNLAAIIFSASKNFKLAKSIIEQHKNLLPNELNSKLITLFFFYEAYTEGISCLKMAKNHENLLQDEPKGQHMGFALSYAKKGNLVLDAAVKNTNDLGTLPASFQQKLRNLSETLKNLSRIFENKNNQIYKNKEFTPNELPGAPEIHQKLVIGPIVPEIFTKPISEESLFEPFISEELEKELHDIKTIIDDYKVNIKKQVDGFKQTKIERFSANSINFITNFSQSQMGKKEIPLAIKTKFQEFEAKGGANNLKQLHKNLIEKCLKCGEVVKIIRTKLENEKNEEKKYKDYYKNLWTTTSSEVLNYEYYQCLNDLLGKFNQAQSVDESIILKYGRNKQNIEIFSKGEEGILNKIPSSIDASFFQSNNQPILILRDKTDQIEKILVKNDQLYNQFLDWFANANVDQKILEAKQKSAFPNQIAQIALNSINPVCNEIEQNIKNGLMLIDSILNDSNSLRNKMLTSSVNAKALEEIIFSLQELNQMIDDLTRGTSFYNNLSQYLQILEQTVDDYVMARQAQFQDLIQMIENGNPKSPAPKNNYSYMPNKIEKSHIEEKKEDPPQLFFNEDLNQFPLGQSVFMPSKRANNSKINESGVNVFESTVVNNLSDSQVHK